MEEFAAYMDAYDRALEQEGTVLLAGQRYAVRSLLRDGESSRVFLLEDPQGEPSVLKVAQGYRRQSLRAEYELLSRMREPCVPRGIALEERGERTCLLRTYVPGETLDAYAEERALTASQVAGWGLKACDIISLVHRQDPPIIHRDIKPQNFIVTPEGELALIDLDSCQKSDVSKSQDSLLLGTLATAAPEQFGARRSDERSDVYGIGMLMLYLLTNDVDLDRLKTSGAPFWLKRIIRRCTSFDPARRYPSIRRLQKSLRQARGWVPRWLALLLLLALLGGAAAGVKAQLDRRAQAKARVDAQRVFINVPLIEQGAAYQLGKQPGTLTREDLRQVEALLLGGDTLYDAWDEVRYLGKSEGTQLMLEPPFSRNVQWGPVRYLDDLRFMPNVRQLGLYKQKIADISLLEGLPLTHLALAENPLRDFSPLSTLEQLEFLDLSGTYFVDSSLLASCTRIKALRLLNTSVQDLTPLKELPLEELFADYEALGRSGQALDLFGGLRRLKITGLPLAALSAVDRRKGLEELQLPEYPGYTLEPLRDLQSLQRLYIPRGQLRSLQGAEKLTSLRTLVMDGSGVSDLSPLYGLPYLEELSIGNTALTDYEQLRKLPSLKRLYVDGAQNMHFPESTEAWAFEVVCKEW